MLERDLPDGLEECEVSTNNLGCYSRGGVMGPGGGEEPPRAEAPGTHTPLHELVSRRTVPASDADPSVVGGSEAYLGLLHWRIVDHWLSIRQLRDWRGIVVLGIEVLCGVN
jgi:hypothetical protein